MVPAFHLHTGNGLECLAAALVEVLPAGGDPFVPETIAVQSRGLARWLAFHLATQRGIAANIRFPFPASLLHELAAANGLALPGDAALRARIWRIAGAIPPHLGDPAFADLARYLAHDAGHRRLYGLAARLADLFDRYDVYRPEWLSAWSRNQPAPRLPDALRSAEDWQATLWRAACREPQVPSKSETVTELVRRLRNPAVAVRGLPPRLALFGLQQLPPLLTALFEAIACRIPVHAFLLNPCPAFWEDLKPKRAMLREAIGRGCSIEDVERELHMETGNSLLAALGTPLGVFLSTLPDDAVDHTHFTPPPEPHLLGRVQADIYHLREPNPAAPAAPTDDSLQFHVAHGPMREVEILHDRLLDLLDHTPGLAPRDLLVLAPDMQAYAPFVEAVFERAADDERRIPYAIADRPAGAGNPWCAAFLALLEVHGSRLSAPQVFSLLDHAPLRAACHLDEDSIRRLQDWTEAAGIRWGYDGAFKQRAFDLPPDEAHTWRWGLDRLLLGFALPLDKLDLFHGILPLNEPEGEPAAALGHLAALVDRLHALHGELARPRPPADWAVLLQRLAREWLGGAGDDPARTTLFRLLADLATETAAAPAAPPAAFDALRETLEERLAEPAGGPGPLLAGGVTFANLVPLRSIPHRVIALLGMNDGAFPRRDDALSFDLTAAAPRPGDRARRADDRYLFLETLLAARDHLLVFYTGRSARDNTPLPPSPLVAELLDYLRATCGPDGVTRLTTEHPLQPFSPRYTSGESGLFTYAREYEPATSPRAPAPAPAPAPPQAIALDDFVAFFRDAGRFFLRRAAAARLPDEAGVLSDTETLALEALDRHTARACALAQLDRNRPAASIRDLLRADGLLPPGPAGDDAAGTVLSAVQAFRTARAALEGGQPAAQQPLSINGPDFTLHGVLDGLYGKVLLSARPGSIKATHLLAAWASLTAAAAAGCATRAELLGISDDKPARLTLHAPREPMPVLASLVALYREGLTEPLPISTETARAFAAHGPAKAAAAWSGGHARGDLDEPHHRLLFDPAEPTSPRFAALAHRAWDALLEQLEKP